ncbi:FtsQ-type POTRA domain-containing protein [Lactobacillus sp. DCY120]|uniref:Cell division protein DivIB n=1 Tax=Bombilactobacillus apium TaxID=2675299 RepID=A0A850R4B2_9LACO|nr:FtsQ-type POTRA domain-containing protein [Bombilactobacillus apium]NVY95677.1 FtsQ-type POTRA domain-containing protein [Bombilactobacillus apium]
MFHKKSAVIVDMAGNEYKNSTPPRRPGNSGRPFFKKLSSFSLKDGLIILLTVIILVVSYLLSPWGHVQTITVSGVNYLGAQEIIDASQINHHSLVLDTLLRKSQIRRKIKQKIPLVKTIDYHYRNFNDLQISVQEHRTVGFLLKDNNYYRILENKKIIPNKLKQPIDSYPVYQDLGPKTSIAHLVELYLSLPSKMRNDISEIHGDPNPKSHPYRLILYMNDGNRVIGDRRTLKAKLRYYPRIASLMSQKGTINLELGAYSYSK